MSRIREIARTVRGELDVFRRALRHPHTPLLAKALLGAALGYFLLPFDLIPDFIPVLGQLDDLVIVPLLVAGALKLIPQEVMEECRVRDRPARPGPDPAAPTARRPGPLP